MRYRDIVSGHRLNEIRQSMFSYLKSLLPEWPDYVMRDWIYNLAKGESDDFRNVKQHISEILKNEGLKSNTKWTLVSDVQFSMDMWSSWTMNQLKERSGGKQNPMGVKNDAERHSTQANLAKQQGGVRSEPVIMIKKSDGWEIIEGWHRTIQHFNMHPNGYKGPAWTAISDI